MTFSFTNSKQNIEIRVPKIIKTIIFWLCNNLFLVNFSFIFILLLKFLKLFVSIQNICCFCMPTFNKDYTGQNNVADLQIIFWSDLCHCVFEHYCGIVRWMRNVFKCGHISNHSFQLLSLICLVSIHVVKVMFLLSPKSL